MHTAMWSGAINLGAVNVPIKLFTATPDQPGKAPEFRTLHRACKAPVTQVKRCSACGEDMRSNVDTVSAYEYAKGRFAVVKKDHLPRPEADDKSVIQVEDFVRLVDLDWFAFARHYWLTPDGAARSYALLHRALAQTGKAAIVRIVLRTKQHLAVVYPRGQHLMLTTLYYHSEITRPDELPPGADGIAVRELDFEGMCSLIEGLSNDYRPERYRDTVNDAARAMLADLVEEAVIATPEAENEAPGGVAAIVDALRNVGAVGKVT